MHREIFAGALACTDCCGTAIVTFDRADQPADRQFVSGDFFSTLGVNAFRGRLSTPADDTPETPGGPVAVVRHRFWRTRLGGRDDVIGSRLIVNRMPVTLIGVCSSTLAAWENRAGYQWIVGSVYRV